MLAYKTWFSLLTIILLFSSCTDPQKEKKQTKTETIVENKNMTNPIDILKNQMLVYQKEFHPSYSKEDIIICGDILNLYLAEIKKSSSREEGLKIVKPTIEKLNILNERCEGSLIETIEREQICEIIINASAQKGYNTMEEDITEAWREW